MEKYEKLRPPHGAQEVTVEPCDVISRHQISIVINAPQYKGYLCIALSCKLGSCIVGHRGENSSSSLECESPLNLTKTGS